MLLCICKSMGQLRIRRRRLSKLEQRRLLEQLELLCQCGVGIEAIAPSACEIFRRLLDADSGSVFWQDENGIPMGYYHDNAPAEIKDFFVANFDALFSDPDETNMVGMMLPTAPNIGKAIRPGWQESYRASNVYKYLSQPLGHEYMLDARIDLDGRGRVLFCAWNKAERPFATSDIGQARLVHDLVLQALTHQRDEIAWTSLASRSAHFMTDIAGLRLVAIDAEAEKWLKSAHLLRQNIPMNDNLREAPSFARALAAQLPDKAAAEMAIPVAAGRLVIRAVRSAVREGESETAQVFFSLDMQRARDVAIIDHLCSFPLTMMQKRIALFAACGGERATCENRFGVSSEALKKHLNTIYATMNASKWSDLAEIAEHLSKAG